MKPQLCTATTPGGHQTKMLGGSQPAAASQSFDELLGLLDDFGTRLLDLAAEGVEDEE